MTSVIATISLKGGVGKTTVTAGVAELMAGEFGRRVLLVDLDSQINLTTMFLGDERWLKLNAAGHTHRCGRSTGRADSSTSSAN